MDLVVARRDGTVILSMLEDRPWDGSEQRLMELEAKVSSYLSFVLDGHMQRDHPDIVADHVQIRLDYSSRMDVRTREAIPAIELAVAEHGMEFVISHMQEIQAG